MGAGTLRLWKGEGAMALDVYGLTRRRDADTINRFLDEYIDRAANTDRGDEDLMIEPLGGQSEEIDWELEPSLTFSHIVERGLAYPRRAFTVYFDSLPAWHDAGIEQVILGFTRDGQLVLGLSVSTIYTVTSIPSHGTLIRRPKKRGRTGFWRISLRSTSVILASSCRSSIPP